MLTVEKIGGTSMSQFQDVLQNIIKGDREGDEFLYPKVMSFSSKRGSSNISFGGSLTTL